MKEKFRQFSLMMLLVMTIGAFFLNSCGDGDTNGDKKEVGLDHLPNDVALFGYNDDDNQFFVQHVTSSMGAEINHGSWSSGNKWKPMTYFTVGGKQYIMGHKKDPNSYFIQEVYTSGDLGKETDTGTWHNYYEVLIGLVYGDRTFIYGESKDASDYWFVQEVLPGGKLGAETDNGEWGVTYDAVVPLPLPKKSCFFAHTDDDAQFYKTMCLNSAGKLYEQDEGHWGHHWPTVASYRAGGQTYLFTHRKKYLWDEVRYSGPWSIVRISDSGDVLGDTDSGEWHNYYKTMTTFYDKGTEMYYLAGMNTDKYFFIQHVDYQGNMQEETDNGTWGHYFDYFLPVAVDPKYLYVDAWMGKQISLIGGRKLTEIALPGSHDAGMNEADRNDCQPEGSARSCNTVTQQGDIAFQLSRGARYFDLRPVLDHGSDGTDNWHTGHNKKWAASLFGCKGEAKQSIVTAVQNFFSNGRHQNELVILKISHCTMRYAGLEYDCTSDQLNNLAKNLAGYFKGNHLFTCKDCRLAEKTLNDILSVGNVLIVVSGEKIDSKPPEIDVESNTAGGVFKYGADSGADFYMYDNYANSDDFTTMRNDQVNKLLNSSNHYNNGIRIPFLLSWTLTLQSSTCSDGSIIDFSKKAQWRLYQEMIDLVNSGKIKKSLMPNVLYVDDFNGTAARTAIYLNEQYGNLK